MYLSVNNLYQGLIDTDGELQERRERERDSHQSMDAISVLLTWLVRATGFSFSSKLFSFSAHI